MKKLLFIALILISPINVGASVEGDTTAVRYKKCIEELAKLESLTYVKPTPEDRVYTMKNYPSTYEKDVQRYNTQIKTRENKRNQCKSLGGGSSTTTQTVQKTVVEPQLTGNKEETVTKEQYDKDIITLQDDIATMRTHLNLFGGLLAVVVLLEIVSIIYLVIRRIRLLDK